MSGVRGSAQVPRDHCRHELEAMGLPAIFQNRCSIAALRLAPDGGVDWAQTHDVPVILIERVRIDHGRNLTLVRPFTDDDMVRLFARF